MHVVKLLALDISYHNRPRSRSVDHSGLAISLMLTLPRTYSKRSSQKIYPKFNHQTQGSHKGSQAHFPKEKGPTTKAVSPFISFGTPPGNRTPNLLIKSQALYRPPAVAIAALRSSDARIGGELVVFSFLQSLASLEGTHRQDLAQIIELEVNQIASVGQASGEKFRSSGQEDQTIALFTSQHLSAPFPPDGPFSSAGNI
ncbi:MAG: hypothetical protein KOO63_00250 [Bacteroidales bacterium]|nr:hypothetical protein [Candidatus Latescibacterota bacterium]